MVSCEPFGNVVVSRRGELEIGEGGCCMIVGLCVRQGENEERFWECGVKKGREFVVRL